MLTSNQIILLLENNNNEVTSQIISDTIDTAKTEGSGFQGLYNRYLGDVKILKRVPADEYKANNMIPNDYRGDIIDTMVGYLFGNQIQYSLEVDNEEAQTKLKDWLKINHIKLMDSELGETISICGKAGRLLYLNADGLVSIQNLDPWEFTLITDGTTGEILYGVIFYERDYVDSAGHSAKQLYAEWYDKSQVAYYAYESGSFTLDKTVLKNPNEHGFDYVPLVEFNNNRNQVGDFENVEKLIDAYDNLVSTAQDELEEFRNAYMLFFGFKPTLKTIEDARKTGAIGGLEANQDVRYLIKELNSEYTENQKKTLNDNIHKFSKIPDMTNEKFGTPESGISRLHKLQKMENKAITKENQFTKASLEMFKILFSNWNKVKNIYRYEDVNLKFTRNIPVDLLYIGSIIEKLSTQLDKETLLGYIPNLDVKMVMERKKAEDEEVINFDDPQYNDSNNV